jgi:hypothetical protein
MTNYYKYDTTTTTSKFLDYIDFIYTRSTINIGEVKDNMNEKPKNVQIFDIKNLDIMEEVNDKRMST